MMRPAGHSGLIPFDPGGAYRPAAMAPTGAAGAAAASAAAVVAAVAPAAGPVPFAVIGFALMSLALAMARSAPGRWFAVSAGRFVPDDTMGDASPADGAAPGTSPADGPANRPPRRQRRTPNRLATELAVHAGVVAVVVAVLVVIWALTTRGSFWPFFPALALGAILATHAWFVVLALRPDIWRRPRMTRALAVHLGLSVIVEVFLVGIWAATTRWYFWPIWPFLGLAAVAALHWVAVLVGRIEHLETTNVDSADLQELDRRRLERDLHDGAQARLIALGMSLGLAEQRFDADPEGARELIGEARAGVTQAVAELRDLVAGIRPPVLADRGLEAAVVALADRTPLPIEVTADIDVRPPDAVETAAYFVVAEAVTNAAKHAGRAVSIDVELRRRGDTLRVEVTDDGTGGADDTGSGLTGLRRRVEALDGSLVVLSPPGGPTIVRAELPCGR
ncbi:MAG: sensor histidine kinase [Actinomycetota bacterium]|nr:sensor histidine kinase [Actinomycetota bacterium]